MSTSLILRPSGQLTETQAAMLAELDREGNAGFDFQPLRLKFPTGGATGAFVLSDGDMLKAPVEMIVAVAQRARAYWPSKETLGKPPLCSAPDGMIAHFNAHDTDQVRAALQMVVRHPALSEVDETQAMGPWDCTKCPLSAWESAGAGARAQACKATRRLLVIVKGWSMPAILTLPPTSVKVWDTFASGLRQRGQAYFSRWITMELNKQTNDKATFAVVNVKTGPELSDAEAAEVMQIRTAYAELVRSMGITADDYDTEGGSNGGGAATGEEELPPF